MFRYGNFCRDAINRVSTNRCKLKVVASRSFLLHNSQCIMHNGEMPHFVRHDGDIVSFSEKLLTTAVECCIFASSDVKNEGSSRNTRTQAVKSDRAQGYVH